MPLDPQRVAECRAWLDRAQADLEAAGILISVPRARPDIALFHCQQAVEKAWKAFLFWHDLPVRRTHDLRELGEAVTRQDGSLESVARKAEMLTPFVWVYRYPGELEEPPQGEAEEALQLAREVYGSIRSRLPGETHA